MTKPSQKVREPSGQSKRAKEPRPLQVAARLAKVDVDQALAFAHRRAVRLFCLRSKIVRAGARWVAWEETPTGGHNVALREWALEHPLVAAGSARAEQSAYQLPFDFVHVSHLARGQDWREVLAGTVLAKLFDALIPVPLRLRDGSEVSSITGTINLRHEGPDEPKPFSEFTRRQSEHGTPLGLADLFAFPDELAAAKAGKGAPSWHTQAVERARGIAELHPDDYRPGGVPIVAALAEALTNDHPPDGLPPILGNYRERLKRRTVANVLSQHRSALLG